MVKIHKIEVHKIQSVHHPLHVGCSNNHNFGDDIKTFVGEELLKLFCQSFFGIYLNMYQCNFQCQIVKCLLMLEIKQDNQMIFMYMSRALCLGLVFLSLLSLSVLNILVILRILLILNYPYPIDGEVFPKGNNWHNQIQFDSTFQNEIF